MGRFLTDLKREKMYKELITKLKEIKTVVELNVGKELTEETVIDIYGLTNELMGEVKKLPIYNVSNRDLYKELRAIGFTHDACDQILDWSETLYGC